MNKLNYQPTDEYRKWWDENRAKLSGHSIYTKGAVIWQAAIAAQEPKQAMTEPEIDALWASVLSTQLLPQPAYRAFARAIERASSPNKELATALQRVEQELIKLEHAVGGGDGEIYVEGAILTCRATLRAAGVEAV